MSGALRVLVTVALALIALKFLAKFFPIVGNFTGIR